LPLQNRVTPFGEIEAHEARGMWMGNRGGCLHDSEKRLGSARWRSRRWITCALSFKGRHRTVMAPGRYTELFFLDEPTSLAAGHRPCAECRREDYRRFVDAFARATKSLGGDPLRSADALDRVLHESRLDGRRQRRHTGPVDSLPDGTMIGLPNRPDTAWLVRDAGLLAWSPQGYTERRKRPGGTEVLVLTPSPLVEAMKAGFLPTLHPSAA
jgi:hypothetical protein